MPKAQDFPFSKLVPLREAAEVFLSKMDSDTKNQFGLTFEEQLENYSKLLKNTTANNFGVVPVHYASELVKVNKSTLQNYTGPRRDKYFPDAVFIERNPETGEEILPNGIKSLCIFHKDFVNWVKTQYNPNRQTVKKQCGLNDLLKDRNGNWLPENERPVYHYTDEAGHDHVARVEPCHNLVTRQGSKFCGEKTNGLKHHVIARMVNGDFAEMGRKASLSKGVRGIRSRTLEAKLLRRRAAQLGSAETTVPLKKGQRRKTAYVPDNFFTY